MFYAKIILTFIVVILSYIITKIVFKVYKNKFYSRNTFIRKFDNDEIKKNNEIVNSKINVQGTISSEEFLRKEK